MQSDLEQLGFLLSQREMYSAGILVDQMIAKRKYLIDSFLDAMNEIGEYGHCKYGVQSFQHRSTLGDRSRCGMVRCEPKCIEAHAANHFSEYNSGVVHDHFETRKHQLAAVAFNAMMEYFYADLENEQ